MTEPAYNRFWKEIIGDFKIEKRRTAGKVSYTVCRDRQADGSWTLVNTYTSKGKARNYVKSQTKPHVKTAEEIDREKEDKRRKQEDARRKRSAEKHLESQRILDARAKEEADAREARGLPREPLYGKVGAEHYLFVMRAKHGPDWKPSTLRVFDNGIKE